MRTFLNKKSRNRVFLHILFWALSFYILLNHFTISSRILLVDYVFTALFHISIVLVVYLNLYVIIPGFLKKQGYWKYIVLLILLYFLFYGLHIFTFDYLSGILFPGYYLIVFYDHIELLKYFAIYIGLTTVFLLLQSWFELAESRKALIEQEKEMVQHELKALKAQVNPHFLFNSLNSIYSLALKNSDQTPEVILKLSFVLRYMIYESMEEKVPLQKELEFLNHYVALQKLRSSKTSPVKLSITGDPGNKVIVPLILIVFLENAFKHGMKGDVKNQFITIDIDIGDQMLKFNIENNEGKTEEVEDDRFRGMGLENVKRRLVLLYPEKYDLAIRRENGKFIVNLTLQL